MWSDIPTQPQNYYIKKYLLQQAVARGLTHASLCEAGLCPLRRHSLLRGQGNDGTGTQAVAAIAGAAPADIDPAEVGVPVHAGNEAAGATRTRTKRDVFHIQVLTGRHKKSEPQHQPLAERDTLVVLRGQLIGREVFVFLISLNGSPKTNQVRAVAIGIAIVLRDIRVQIITVSVDIDAELPIAGNNLVRRDARNHRLNPKVRVGRRKRQFLDCLRVLDFHAELLVGQGPVDVGERISEDKSLQKQN